MKKTQRKQFVLPNTDLSLSLLVGIEGERYLNMGDLKSRFGDGDVDPSMPFWKKAIVKFLSPPSEN